MIGLAIAAVVGAPVAFLAVGFLGVSKTRAEEGRAHITPMPNATTSRAESPTAQPTQKPTQPAF